MTRPLRYVAMVAAGMGVCAASCVPVAWADPSAANGQPASAVIDDLKERGYNVQINWVNGFDTKPLSECRVTGVNDPGDAPPTDGTFTTVYVDVACPNGDDGGFSFGVGIG
jgi:hypothetical protein